MADPTLGYTLAQQGVNLAETPTSSFNYRYPLTKLTSSDDYLKITILEYKPPGFGATGFVLNTAGEVGGYEKSIPKGTIILPIPDDVQDKNSATWGKSSVGPIAAGVLSFGQKAVTDPENIVSGITGVVGSILGVSKTGTGQRIGQAAAIGYAANVLLNRGDQDQANVLSRYAGGIFNSNIELVFSSVNIREPFTFAFDIVPRSQKEAQQVKEIIRAFKKYSAAKKSKGTAFEGLFLKAPEVFKLEYMNGNKPHPYLNKFKICALQSMSVNYTPSNTYATYADGAPVNMTLGLSFQELTPIYAEDYDTGVGKDGMGY